MDELALRTLLKSLEASRSSLHVLLHCFTWAVVVGLGLDLIVIIKEFWDDWKEFRYGQVHPCEIHLPKRPSVGLLVVGLLGTALIVVGVAGELYVDVQAGKIETQIREANDNLLGLIIQEAGDAATSAKTAHEEADAVKGIADEARADAKDALEKAQAAQRELAHAEADAAKAQAVASKALSTADKAESHLAEAMKRANELTEQLKRLTTPRSLPHSPQAIASLKPFNGTEYMFTEVCADTECVNLLRDIDSVLGLAGWKRIKSPHRFPGLVLWGEPKDDDGAGIDLEPGIKISIESQDLDIDKRSIADLPQYIRAAVVLNLTLASNIVPTENTGRPVEKQIGISTAVRIAVGRKPLT
jgi:hypothetical protein